MQKYDIANRDSMQTFTDPQSTHQNNGHDSPKAECPPSLQFHEFSKHGIFR